MLAMSAVFFYLFLMTFSTVPVVAGISLIGTAYGIYWSVR